MSAEVKGDIARQMAASAPTVEPSKGNRPKENPIVRLFGTPTFQLESSKEYPDERIKGKTSQKVARALFTLAKGVIFKATIYRYSQSTTLPGGQVKRDTWHTFSLPKGAIEIPKELPEFSIMFDAWRESIEDAYLDWRKTVDQSVATDAKVRNRRHVETELIDA